MSSTVTEAKPGIKVTSCIASSKNRIITMALSFPSVISPQDAAHSTLTNSLSDEERPTVAHQPPRRSSYGVARAELKGAATLKGEATGSPILSRSWGSRLTTCCASTACWPLSRKILCRASLPGTVAPARLIPDVAQSQKPYRKSKRAPSGASVPPAILYDQYYTKEEVARALYDQVVKRYDPEHYQMLEPSAGTGAFFKLMPYGSLACDIDPKYPGIIRADFLTCRVESVRKVVTVGNPPFGRNSSSAVAFFNHAGAMSDVIAFVLPRTFRKQKLQNRLHSNFHLVYETVVPAHAFLFMGKPYNVPAVFQIWERRKDLRALHILETTHPDFEFTTSDDADFAIQRVGARAGRIHHDFVLSKNSHYFIRVTDRSTQSTTCVESIMVLLNLTSAAGNVAGKPSLAKSEIVARYKSFTKCPVPPRCN